MAAYNFERLVDDTHTVQLPPEVPQGWAKFSVVPMEKPVKSTKDFLAMLAKMHETPAENPKTVEEILQYVRTERDSWE